MARHSKVKTDFKALRNYFKRQSRLVLHSVSREGVRIAKRLTPVGKSGRLKKSIMVTSITRRQATYGSRLYYSRQRELGGPIFPRRRRALHFYWDKIRAWVFFKRVRQKGSFYLTKSAPILQAKVPKIARRFFK